MWQEKTHDLVERLVAASSVAAVAEATGISQAMIYGVLAGTRGVGPRTLEALRRAYPDEVAGVFLPPDSPIVEPAPPIVEAEP